MLLILSFRERGYIVRRQKADLNLLPIFRRNTTISFDLSSRSASRNLTFSYHFSIEIGRMIAVYFFQDLLIENIAISI